MKCRKGWIRTAGSLIVTPMQVRRSIRLLYQAMMTRQVHSEEEGLWSVDVQTVVWLDYYASDKYDRPENYQILNVERDGNATFNGAEMLMLNVCSTAKDPSL